MYRVEGRGDRRQVVAAAREVRRHGGQVALRAYVEDQAHAYNYVVDEVAVE